MPQSLAMVSIHLVFSTKGRQPFIEEPIQPRLFQYLTGILRGEGHIPMVVGGHVDHVHLLFALSRTQSIASAVEHLKRSSSIWMKEFQPGFSWQGGYGAFGVSLSDSQAVTSYILNQAEHHQRFSFQDEFRQLCSEHGIEIDERYVWD